jgi:hypothetical protein
MISKGIVLGGGCVGERRKEEELFMHLANREHILNQGFDLSLKL